MLQLTIVIVAVILIGWLAAWMLAQRPVTNAQQLIQQHRYADAVAAAANDPLHRAEALKLLGRFDDAIASYRSSDDPAARGKGLLSHSRTSGAISTRPDA